MAKTLKIEGCIKILYVVVLLDLFYIVSFFSYFRLKAIIKSDLSIPVFTAIHEKL